MARYLKFRARLAERWRKKPPKRNGIVQKFHDLIGIPPSFLVDSSKVAVFVREIALLEENSNRLSDVKKKLQPDTIIRRRDAVEATRKKMDMQDE